MLMLLIARVTPHLPPAPRGSRSVGIGFLPMSPRDVNDSLEPIRSSGYRLSWMLGAAMLVAVIVAAFHFSEGRELVAVAQGAKLRWLVRWCACRVRRTLLIERSFAVSRAHLVAGCH
jgi:hypothetical protein